MKLKKKSILVRKWYTFTLKEISRKVEIIIIIIIIIMSRCWHGSLWPSLTIVHRSWEVFQAISCIGTELFYIGSSWSSKLRLSIWRGPQEYITYELVRTSPAVSGVPGSSNLDIFHNEWYLTVQQQFSRVLPSGLVQYSSQHSWVIAVKLFLHSFI